MEIPVSDCLQYFSTLVFVQNAHPFNLQFIYCKSPFWHWNPILPGQWRKGFNKKGNSDNHIIPSSLIFQRSQPHASNSLSSSPWIDLTITLYCTFISSSILSKDSASFYVNTPGHEAVRPGKRDMPCSALLASRGEHTKTQAEEQAGSWEQFTLSRVKTAHND